MPDLKDGDDKSNKVMRQEAEIDLNDANFGFNVSIDDCIQEIINCRESNNRGKTSDSEPKVNETT